MSTLRQRAAAAIVGLPPETAPKPLPSSLVALFALVCGATIANVYYAQSLVGPIAQSLGVPENLAGTIVMLTQLGFGAGLFFVVCLGDLIENRRLILVTSAGVVLSLIGVAASRTATPFFIASFALGVSSVGAQILLPLAAHLSPEKMRGRVIGNIMGGLLAGIMLSRPVASFLTAAFGWRAVFMFSAVLMLAILALLARILPQRQPRPDIGYGGLLKSMLQLLATSPTLRRRAAYQGTLFAAFNMFWTAAPLMLHNRFGFGQDAIALFALAGAGGAVIAPLAGRLADWGFTRATTGGAMVCVIAGLLVTGWATAAGALTALTLATIVFDAAVQANHIVGQRTVYGISAEARGRLNAVYMTCIFLCGAVGSSLGSLTYVDGGWWTTASVAAVVGAIILVVFTTEYRRA